ncbi:MAG: hypothetical protein ABI863_12545 [Ginsengibacter sp.]
MKNKISRRTPYCKDFKHLFEGSSFIKFVQAMNDKTINNNKQEDNKVIKV